MALMTFISYKGFYNESCENKLRNNYNVVIAPLLQNYKLCKYLKEML